MKAYIVVFHHLHIGDCEIIKLRSGKVAIPSATTWANHIVLVQGSTNATAELQRAKTTNKTL